MKVYSANNAFYLLFASSLLTFVLLVSLFSKISPLTVSHTIYFCQQVMHGISFSMPHSFPSYLELLLLLIFSTGFLLLIVQVIKTHRYVNSVLNQKIPTPVKMDNLARQLGILDKLDVVKTGGLSSFCYGLINPRICLNLNLVKKLTSRELKALLIHESYHLKNRDPLKILLGQVVVSMFFFVPSLKDIQKFYSLSKEINADQLVVSSIGVKSLKSALAKTLSILTPSFVGVAPFATNDDIEKRFHILVHPSDKLKILISPFKLILSIFFVSSALVFLNLPVHAMENKDGTHSYFIMSREDVQMVSCFTENVPSEHPFSSQRTFSPANYSTTKP